MIVEILPSTQKPSHTLEISRVQGVPIPCKAHVFPVQIRAMQLSIKLADAHIQDDACLILAQTVPLTKHPLFHRFDLCAIPRRPLNNRLKRQERKTTYVTPRA